VYTSELPILMLYLQVWASFLWPKWNT